MDETTTAEKRPYFIWDYDLSDQDVHHILRHGDRTERAWLITRILEYSKWEDIWRYLTVADIQRDFKWLRFRHSQDRELWAYALDRWTHSAS
jgi:hypothetical protein